MITLQKCFLRTILKFLFFLSIMLCSSAWSNCKISIQDFDMDSKNEVKMENMFLSLTFKPSKGGTLVNFVHKTTGNEYTGDFIGNVGGMLQDMDWEHPWEEQEFITKEYNYEIIKDTPDEAILHMWAKGQQIFKFITIHKTIHLYKNYSNFYVDYEIHNDSEAMSPTRFALWLHNIAFPQNQKAVFYWTTPKGIEEKLYDNRSTTGDLWNFQPVRGWTGFIGERGANLACSVSYKDVYAFYNWFSIDCASLEWRYAPVLIKEGESFKTSVCIFPFTGLKRLDHATKNSAFSVMVDNEYQIGQKIPIKVQIAGAENVDFVLKLSTRTLDKEEWIDIGMKKITLQPDKINDVEFEYLPHSDTGIVFKFTLLKDGEELDSFERVIASTGKPIKEGRYRYVPLENRRVVKNEQIFFPWTPSREIVTPHIKWFTPYYKKKPKVLVLMQSEGQREIVELAQRMDIDYVTATILSPSDYRMGWYPPASDTVLYVETEKRCMEWLENLLQCNYDLIIISNWRGYWSNTDWNNLSKHAQRKILDMVQEGTGLLMIGPDKMFPELRDIYTKTRENKENVPSVMISGIPFDKTFPVFNKKDIYCSSYGNGRVVLFDYNTKGLTPSISEGMLDDFPKCNYWEYCYLALARAALWVCKQEPDIELNFSISKPILQENEELHLEYISQTQFPELSLELSITDETGNLEWSNTKVTHIEKGHGLQIWKIPDLKSGVHFAHIRTFQGQKIVNSAAYSFEVKPNMAIIEDIFLSNEIVKPGEEFETKVVVKRVEDNLSNNQLQVIIELSDNYQRVLNRKEYEVSFLNKVFEKQLTFKIDTPVCVIHYITVKLMSGERIIAEKTKELYCPSVAVTWDDWEPEVWFCGGVLPPYLQKYRMAALKNLGFKDILQSYIISTNMPIGKNLENQRTMLKTLMRTVAQVNMTPMHLNFWSGEQTFWNWTKYKAARMTRMPCLSDPYYRRLFQQKCEVFVEDTYKYGVSRYILGDESSLGHYESSLNLCFSPYCQDAFKKWLKDKYKELSTLNTEWETDYKNWDEPEPKIEEEIKDYKNLSQWLDFRTFMDTVYCGFLQMAADTFHSIEPKIRIGISGTTPASVYNGYDWYLLMKAYGIVNTYGDSKLQQSFNPDCRFQGWTGYRQEDFKLWDAAWRRFLMGEKGWAYHTDDMLVLWDIKESPLYANLARNVISLFGNGLGKQLLFVCEREIHPIAIHYSKPSIFASYMQKYTEGIPDFLEFFRKVAGGKTAGDYGKVLEDLGYQYKYLAQQQVETDELRKLKYKIFIMPLSMAISDSEANYIEKFVRDGGIVIADCMTGVMDEHGKKRGNGILDKLFGIKRDQPDKYLQFDRKELSDRKINISIFEKGISVTDGIPKDFAIEPKTTIGNFQLVKTSELEKLPVLIEKTVGKGKVIYLGFLGNYGSLRRTDTSLKYLYKEIIEESGLKPEIRITDLENKDFSCEVTCFKNQNLQFIGLYRPLEDFVSEKSCSEKEVYGFTERCRVYLPHEYFIYDVLEGKLIGYSNNFETSITPGKGRVFAYISYRIEGLKINTADSCKPGEKLDFTIELESEGEKPGNHVFHFDVFDPDGKKVEYFAKNLVSENGTYTGKLPFSLNAQKGIWRILVNDIPSGKTSERRFEIK